MASFARAALWLSILAFLIAGCAREAPSAPGEGAQPTSAAAPSSPSVKSITVGITSTVPAMSIIIFATPAGGWLSLTEIHSEGLVTSDTNSRTPVGRLATSVPSLDDGSIEMLPDGREKVVFELRQGVTWQDGARFTADDMVFSYQIGGPNGIPNYLDSAAPYIASVEAPNPQTFIVYYKQPYYQGAVLGPFALWPLPQHLLGDAYQRFLDTKDANEVLNSPYWTSSYVNLGPFRLTQFDPANELTFQAYDRFFLGRPHIDTIHVRVFSDENTLFSNMIAGTVDLVPELALQNATGPQLKSAWDANGNGTVYAIRGAIRRFDPQYRPDLQEEPTILDPRVRMALMRTIDREALSDAENGGNLGFVAWSILGPSDPLYSAAQDDLHVYDYNPNAARALLQDAGWVFSADGSLRYSVDNRPFRTAVYVSTGVEGDASTIADYWRQLGIQVDEHTWTAAETRDAQARSQYPGWNGTGGNPILQLGMHAASADNGWTGNQSGFEDPQAQQLIGAYRSSVSLADQLQAMRNISAYYVAQLPAMPTYYIATYLAARKGVSAFTPDDVAGFVSDSPLVYAYGTLSRNSYLWDVQ